MVILLSNLFKFVSDKPHGISYLLSPANIEEKFIVNILISHLYFSLLLIAPIILGYNTGRWLCASPDLPFVFYDISLFRYRVILVFFGIQALFMFGVLFFKKNGAIKTFLCLIILFVIGIITFFRLAVRLNISADDLAYYIDDLTEKYDYIFHIFNYIGIFTLWILSYFRLKKLEV